MEYIVKILFVSKILEIKLNKYVIYQIRELIIILLL